MGATIKLSQEEFDLIDRASKEKTIEKQCC